MSNTISDLRKHLFDALKGLKDKEQPMEVARALAISDVAQTIINSAKLEIDLVRAVNGSRPGSLEFFGVPAEEPVAQLPTPAAAIAKRDKRLEERMPWPKDYAAVDPLARKAV